MKTGIKVGSIMTRNFISVGPKTSLFDCISKMHKAKVGSLLVEENQNLKGIITDTDIIKAIAMKTGFKVPIEKIMTKKILSMEAQKDLYEAMIFMRKNKIRRVPIVAKKKVIGMLTLKDILKIEPELFEIVIQNVQIAEEEEKRKRLKYTDEYKWISEGPCDECGGYDLLYKEDGRYLCSDCRKALKR